MEQSAKKGFPLAGVLFLALAGYEFAKGENWVVWAILGCLFGGLGIFSNRKSEGDRS